MAKQQIKFRSQQSITYLPEGYIHLTLYAGVQQKRLPALLELHRKRDIFGEGPEWIVVPWSCGTGTIRCEVPTIGPAKQYQPLHPEIVEPELDNARVTENPPEPRHVRELP